MARKFSWMMLKEAFIRWKEIVWACVSALNGSSVVRLFMKATERVLFAAFTCVLTLGGSLMGTFVGAIKGQTTEAGFLDGASKGAVTGAIAALGLLDLVAGDEPLSKVAMLRSLFDGKVLMEWVYPTYQWHIGTPETIFREVSDIYDIMGVSGLSQNFIQKLPLHQFNSGKMLKLYNDSCCSICFQDFENEELVRILPKCDHFFHFECIDKWLIQQGSCPMCRTYVTDHIDE